MRSAPAFVLMVLLAPASQALLADPLAARLAAAPDDPLAAARHVLTLAEDLRGADPHVLGLGRAALDLASVAARDGALPSDIIEAAMPVLELQGASARTLADARWVAATLRTLEATPAPATTDEALALAHALVSLEPLPTSLQLPPSPRFSSLADALDALFAAYPHSPLRAEQRVGLDAVLAAPPDVQRALTRLVEAELRATAFAKAALAAEDYGALALVRADVVAAVREALPALAPVATAQNGADKTLLVCGVIGLDLAGVATEWPAGCDVPLLVDVGGDDLYRNNAGGAHALAEPVGSPGRGGLPAAIAVDVAGDDAYLCEGYALNLPVSPPPYDLSRGGCAGGSNAGAGHLFDLAGADAYETASSVLGAMGGTQLGSGFLLDAAGSDVYLARSGPANGGSHRGTGFLLDVSGDDRYSFPVRGASFICCGNGASNSGFASLLDLAGSDVYECFHANSCNGAAGTGVGLLADLGEGSDVYHAHARNYANGGLVVSGIAGIVDGGGDNRFETWGTVSLGGHITTSALDGGAVGVAGLGFLFSGEGNDTYVTHPDFLDPLASRMIRGEQTTQGASLHGGFGLLVDGGGRNSYFARAVPGETPIAQGAGTGGGLGLVVDRGVDSAFAIEDGIAGQGAGVQGVGLIVGTRAEGVMRYSAAPASLPSLVAGGGLGMRASRGAFALVGAQPRIQCPEDTYEFAGGDNLTLVDRRLLSFHVCSPDGSEREPVRNPLDGKPLDPFPKPAVPCRAIPPCGETIDALLGPGPVDWLARGEMQSTTSGGFTSLSGQNAILARAVAASFDDVCQVTCAGTGALDTGG